MALFDVSIILLLLSMCAVALYGNRGNPVALGRKARFLPFAGLGLIALFYAVDFAAVNILPELTGPTQSMQFMTNLHWNWSWPVNLVAVGLISVGYLCAVREATEAVTELEKAEREAQFMRARMEDFASAASDWFWEMDAELRYVWCSSAIESVIGAPPETLYGRKREELKESYKPNALWEAQLERLSKHEPFKDFIYPRQGLDGIRWIRSSGIPVFDCDGEFAGYRGTGKDVTRELEAELALQESEALLVSIFENVPLGLLIKNADHVIERVNDAFVRWYGREAEALIGQRVETLEGFLSDEDAAIMLEQEEEIRVSGRILTRQVDRAFADGSVHTISITKFPVRSRNGKIEKIGSISVDLTEQTIAQKALLESERRYRDFAESASDWSWETDDQLRFSAVSDRFPDIMGFEASSFIGKTRRDMAQENVEEEKWRRHCDDLDNRRAFRDFRYDTRQPGGGILTMSISGKPIFDENGVFQGYRGTGTNFTEQRRAEVARDVALQEALNANEAKSKFLANMSHDLRTPLNAILGFSDILREELLGPLGEKKYREYANDIHSSASYLLDLVNDLLDISTIEAGKKSLFKERLSVGDLIDDCVRVFVSKAYSKDVNLVTEVPPELPLLNADKRATRQILVNLLGNAVKFTPGGGTVTALARATGRDVEIVVKDTGKGIPAERLADVINPFTRGEQSPYEAEMGWGLGLSIVHSLVELHGGEMDIQSPPGEGTIVTITLPNNSD